MARIMTALLESLESLTAEGVVDAARRIEDLREASDSAELLRAHHGFDIPGLWTTPFQWYAGVLAREEGFFSFDRLERTFLRPVPGWIRHDVQPDSYAVTLDRTRLRSGAMWPFRQDATVADFEVTTAPKWWSHGLVHALVGFAWWPDLDEWELAAMSRLDETVASWHWYWLSELGRAYCPSHGVQSGDRTPDCGLCASLEADAAKAAVRRQRLDTPSALAIAGNSLEVLRYEAACFGAAIQHHQLVVPQGNYLDLGEACDYARIHLRRLRSPAFRRWLDHCMVAGVDYRTSSEAFDAHVSDVAQRLLSPAAPSPDRSAQRAIRVLQDLGWRLCHAAEWRDAGSDGFQSALTSVSDALDRLRSGGGSADGVDGVLGDALGAIVEELDATNAEQADRVLQVGYRPTTHPAREPRRMREARMAALVRRTNASGSPLAAPLRLLPELQALTITSPRTGVIATELAGAATRLAAKDQNQRGWMIEALFGWMRVCAEQWAEDDPRPFVVRRWTYRLSARALPPEVEWDAWRVQPSPYLNAVPVPFDLRWLDACFSGALPADKTFKPKPTTRAEYVLVGPGREAPRFLAFLGRRKRLLDALQHTPTLAELVERGFTREELAESLAEDLVVCLHKREPVTLYMPPMGVTTTDGVLQADGRRLPVPGPWNEIEQADYYEALCDRLDLYREVSAALIEQAELPPAAQVADLGCGTGVTAQAALARLNQNGRLVGVDPALRMVGACRRRVDDARAEFEQGSARILPVLAGRRGRPFDRIVCSSALWLDHDLGEALQAIRSSLAADGRFAFSIPAEYLGHVDHRLGVEHVQLGEATIALQQEYGLTNDGSTLPPPHPELLGSVDNARGALVAAGFEVLDVVLWSHPWTMADYLDWSSQPVVLEGLFPGVDPADHPALVQRLREAVDLSAPLESRWYLVTARPRASASGLTERRDGQAVA